MENFMLKSLTPMLETSDIKGTIDYYTGTLNFSCDNFDENYGWAHLSKDEVKIMFSKPNEHKSVTGPVMSGSLYFNTDEVDVLWDKLKDSSNICYPLEDFDYGMREFAIFDNNGYLLQFGQELT